MKTRGFLALAVSATLIGGMFATTAHAESASAATTKPAVKTTTMGKNLPYLVRYKANARSAPNGKIVAKIAKGATVKTVGKKSGKWYQVKTSSGKTYWMSNVTVVRKYAKLSKLSANTYYRTTKATKAHSIASTSASSVVKSLAKGVRVKSTGYESAAFREVKVGGQNLWIPKNASKRAVGPLPGLGSTSKGVSYVASIKLNARNYPGTGAQGWVLRTIPKGAVVKTTGRTTIKWQEVTYGGKKYFVSYAYLKSVPSLSKLNVASARVKDDFLVPWKQNSIVVNLSTGSNTQVRPPKAFTAKIQQRRGSGAWKTMRTVKAATTGQKTYLLPKGSKSAANGSVSYRVQFTNPHYKTVTSPVVKATWSNPLKSGAKAAQAYNYMKSHCSTTPIEVKSIGGLGVTDVVRNKITINSAAPAVHMRTTALHECAHVRQFKLYSSDWSSFVKKANAIYGGSGYLGVERNAECIANIWHKNSTAPYGAKCTGKALAMAKAMANNKRY